MDISTLLSGAGQVSTGVRDREAELRRAREEQLALEALNRQNRARQIDTQATVAPPPDFGPMRPRQDVGVAPLAPAAAPAAPTAGVRVKPADNPTTTVGKVPAAAPVPTEPPPMTQAEFMALPPERRAQILQTANDRRLLKAAAGFPAAIGGGVADLATAPYRGYAMAAEGIANSRVGRALGITNPGQRMEVFGSGTASGLTGDEKSFPLAAKGSRMITDNMLPWTEEDYIKTLPATNSKTRTTRGGPARRKNAAGGLAVPGEGVSVEGFESQKAADRYNKLTSGLPAALQNPQTQQIMSRAQALGVDPAAAVTVFGIETTYGANANTSGKGAKGPMQVTDETFAAMKRWFSDPASSPNATPAQRAAAAALNPGNTQSWIDAGLLRLAYNEQVGVPKALWGAAYQANAEKVRDNGAPLSVDDGHFKNSEYHSVFVNLYNQVASALGGMSPISTAQAGPVGDVAGAAVGQGGGSGVVMRGTADQTLPVGVENRVPLGNAAAGGQISPAQFYLSNPQAIGRDVRMAQQQRDELVRMAQMYQQSGMGNEYRQVRQAIMALDNQTANLIGIQAVQEMEFANDPTRLSQMLSYVQGQQIDLKPYNNGTFDIIINGVTAHKNVPGAKIKEDALSLFDPQFAAMKAEMAKEAHKGAIADRSEVVKQTAKMIADLRLEQFKGDVQMQVEYLKKTTGWDVKPDTNTGLVYILPPGEREPLVWSPEGRTIERDSEKITINSAQPIAGLR